ncbi:MAG TPA: AMP-binding protein [Intrasporangiaceae bacterium]|nr:AMP-binding protein [Intrasporangiaceae bacterium]
MSPSLSESTSTADLIAVARQQSLGDLPRRSAQRTPDKVAFIDGQTQLTFAEFDAIVDRAAAAIADAGLSKGDRLAVLSHNCWQFVVLNFATARLGVILVPINFMLGAGEIAYILDHSGATAFVVEDALVPVADAALASATKADIRHRRAILSANTVPVTGWEDLQEWFDHDGTPPQVIVADDDPVRMMFTSGTESRPKAALLTSRSLIWQYTSCIVDGGMAGDDVDLHTLPLYHCAQLDCFLGPDLYLSATSVILPAPAAEPILSAIETHKVTKFFAPPTVWIGLLRNPKFDDYDLSSLRKGYYGASAMPVEILKEIQTRLPDVELWNFYGQTEMSPVATILKPHQQLTHPGSAGRPVLNVETRLVDDYDQDVPQGEVGEIVHRSPHATLGYDGDEEKTREAFRNGWFHSGDLGYLDKDGYLYVVDRKKDMIKTGGENVASREVEEALYELDGVAEVAVFGVSHPRWVEAVVAAIVPVQGSGLTVEDVKAHARATLAGYKRPKYVVITEELPKNPSGKIMKRELRMSHADIAEHDDE